MACYHGYHTEQYREETMNTPPVAAACFLTSSSVRRLLPAFSQRAAVVSWIRRMWWRWPPRRRWSRDCQTFHSTLIFLRTALYV